MNLIIGLISLVITFTIVILVEKIFKKEGLFVWMSISTILANILVCKSIDVAGLSTNLGNILFASNFLIGDILSEKYSYEDSSKSVLISAMSVIFFIITTQLALLYIPSEIDLANESMKTLFAINLRVSISSLIMYVLSNLLNIYIYKKLREKFPKKLWLRNNVSTIISNCLENYIFTTLAFIGIFDIKTIFMIAGVASIIEMVIAILDTPFIYISTKVK